MNFLKLIRYKNLLMLVFMQLIFRYGFLKLQNIPLGLSNFNYCLLILSTVLIAAAGYVVNDIFDQDTDSYNKPKDLIVGRKITEATAYNIYAGLNIAGVLLGFYISYLIGHYNFSTLFVLIAALLYMYATSLKQIAVVGNLVVALLLGVSVLIIGVYDLFPVMMVGNRVAGSLFSVLLDYAIFAFMINFIREIVKDLEDIKGDDANGIRTLAVILGVKKTNYLVAALTLIPIAFLSEYIFKYLVSNNLFVSVFYALAFIIAPLFYFIIKIVTAQEQKEFGQLSLLLKLVLLAGIVSIVVLNLNIQHYV